MFFPDPEEAGDQAAPVGCGSPGVLLQAPVGPDPPAPLPAKSRQKGGQAGWGRGLLERPRSATLLAAEAEEDLGAARPRSPRFDTDVMQTCWEQQTWPALQVEPTGARTEGQPAAGSSREEASALFFTASVL